MEPITRRSSSEPLVLLALALAALFGMARLWGRAHEGVGVDFYQFWAVGRAVAAAPGSDPYSEEGRREMGGRALAGAASSPALAAVAEYRRVLATYSTPFLYAIFGLPASGRYGDDHIVFQGISILAAAAGILLLGAAAGLEWPLRLGLLAFVLEWNEPLYSDTTVGNVTRLQLGLVAAAIVLAGRRSAHARISLGVLLAAAVLFKPNLAFVPLLLGIVLLRRRRGRDLGLLAVGLAAGAAMVIALAWWAGFPPPSWARWARAAGTLPDTLATRDFGNMAIARALQDAWGIPAAAAGLALAVAFVGGFSLVLVKSGAVTEDEERLGLAAGGLAYLLSGTLVWIHYFVLALPIAILSLGASARPRCGRLATLALGLMAVRPFFLLTGIFDLRLEMALLDGAVVLLTVALVRGIVSRAPGAPPR